MTTIPECTCPLIDVSTWGKVSFALGNPRGSGCPIHETEEMRNEHKAAEERARYGERADGGPIDPERVYRIGEDGPAPLVLPRGWEQYESGSRLGGQIKAALSPEELEEFKRRFLAAYKREHPGIVLKPELPPVDTNWVTLETFKVGGWRVLAIVLAVAAASALITYAAMTYGG